MPYYKDRRFDFEGVMKCLRAADHRSAVVLHACAHNPTGCDPSREQWKEIAQVIKENGIFPIIDSAYLGFNSGSYDEDAWAVRHLVEDLNLEVAVGMSFAKNMGLYGERVGLTAIVTRSEETKKTVYSLLQNAQRQTISNPPVYGARIAATVLSNPDCFKQWQQDLITMSSRIKSMRQRLYDELVRLQPPGDWSHIISQTGMFGYTGISSTQIKHLEGMKPGTYQRIFTDSSFQSTTTSTWQLLQEYHWQASTSTMLSIRRSRWMRWFGQSSSKAAKCRVNRAKIKAKLLQSSRSCAKFGHCNAMLFLKLCSLIPHMTLCRDI